MNRPSPREDRLWAVLAHLSSLAFGMGILLPIVGWSDQRRKSNYASFQSLQALGYQSLGFTVWILSYLLVIVVVLIVFVVESFQAERAGRSYDLFAGPGTILLLLLLVGFFSLYFLLPIIAAIACALGKDFHYPILGALLARYLEYQPAPTSNEHVGLNEDHELRWIAAMGHFSILIILWGMLAPLTTWILYGKRSLFLKFQSIQALLLQAGATILYFGGIFLYLLGFLSLLAGSGTLTEQNFNSPSGILSIVVFGVTLLTSFVLILLVPCFHILGQWAGYRILKGDNYRYPLIGKAIENWMARGASLAQEENAL